MTKKPPFTPDNDTPPFWPLGLVVLGILLLLYPVPLGLKLAAAVCIIMGFAFYGGIARWLMRRSDAIPDHVILRIARDHRGVVTPALLSLEARCSVETAQATLERCLNAHLCAVDVDANGRVEYHFTDFTDGGDDLAGRHQ